MKFAQIKDTEVINIIFVESSNVPSWVQFPEYIESENAEIGDFYINGVFTPPLPKIPTAADNYSTALYLLQQTDWSALADISNPLYSNPYLENQDEFLSYRSKIRAIAVNPTEGNIDFPTQPTVKWSS